MTVLEAVADLDRRISNKLLLRPSSSRGKSLTTALARVSQTGSYGVGWVFLFAVVVTLLEGPLPALACGSLVVGTLFLNTLVKNVFRRPRPPESATGHKPSSWSMPSAHTSMAVVGAWSITMVLPSLWFLWWGWALVLAASRILLGMHFAGDVLAGALLGLVIAAFVAQPLLAHLL